VQPHSRLTREADNLRLTVPITALEAYRGGPIDVQTPWGRVALKLPAGSQNGQTLRVRGHGVRRSKSQGDLLVTLDVRLPKRSSDKLIDALAELQQDENPREGIGL
jgi:DnaJ-class molecular chaperone